MHGARYGRNHDQLQPDASGIPPVLEPALAALIRMKATIDAADIPDPTLAGRADGMLAQGVHKLIQSDQIDADTPLETVDLIATWIEAACASSHPEVEEDTEVQFEDSASWGSPAARIDGAKAALDLCLCQRRHKTGPTTGLKTGQLVRTKSLGLRPGIIGCGEAAVAERKPISRSR